MSSSGAHSCAPDTLICRFKLVSILPDAEGSGALPESYSGETSPSCTVISIINMPHHAVHSVEDSNGSCPAYAAPASERASALSLACHRSLLFRTPSALNHCAPTITPSLSQLSLIPRPSVRCSWPPFRGVDSAPVSKPPYIAVPRSGQSESYVDETLGRLCSSWTKRDVLSSSERLRSRVGRRRPSKLDI